MALSLLLILVNELVAVIGAPLDLSSYLLEVVLACNKREWPSTLVGLASVEFLHLHRELVLF